MKFSLGMIALLLSASTLAYTPLEITALINQQTHSSKHLVPHQVQQFNSSLAWQSLQGPVTSDTLQIVPMKNNNALLFAYTPYYYGPIYQSRDAGQHWKKLESSPRNKTLHNLISIDENHLLLAADNEIYASDDQGEHWRLLTTVDDSCDQLFALNPKLIFLITNHSGDISSLYRSTDFGKTWTPASLGIDKEYPFWRIYGRDNLLLTSTYGVYISTNQGTFWHQPSANWKKVILPSYYAINKQHDIFIASGRVFKTDITGQTWENISQDLGRVEIIKMDTADRLYAVSEDSHGKGLYRYRDKEKTWELLHLFRQILGITLLDNGKIIINTGNGLMESDEHQKNFHTLTPVFSSASKISHAIALDENDFFAIGSQFSGPLYHRHQAENTWSLVKDGNVIDVVAFNQQLITLEYTRDNRQLMLSPDKGKTWQILYTINNNECDSLSSQHGGLTINCEKDSYFTRDLSTWHTLKADSYPSKLNSYFSGKNLYITNAHSIKRSHDDGQTWTTLLDNLNCYYALITGYKDELLLIALNDAGIIKMTNHSWDLINTGLSDYHFTGLVLIDQNHYVVSTDNGIFSTEDGGNHWQGANDGLDNFNILSLFAYQKTLLLGTKGSGVFKTTLV